MAGRQAGVALALGFATGSCIWSAVAAGGMSAIILASEWAIIGLRFAVAAYLGWLAFKPARAAFRTRAVNGTQPNPRTTGSYMRGLLIHLTNPKAILFFGALYAFGLQVGATTGTVLLTTGAVVLQSILIFVGLAVMFSHPPVAEGIGVFGEPSRAFSLPSLGRRQQVFC